MTKVYTLAAWKEEGARRFGEDQLDWKFVCPCCGHVASVREWGDAGAPNAVAFSCIGRWTGAKRDALRGSGPGPCNYAGGGLFNLHPVEIIADDGHRTLFDFAEVAGDP